MPAINAFFVPSYKGNIPKFFAYRILYNFMLFLPVWVIYMQGKFGLTLTEVTLNDSAFWLTMALTEVPTGAVADTWGRKQSQLIGMVIATGSILLFALAPTYPLVLLGNSLWAFGITFISGADLALLYDTLRELGQEADYPKYRGRLQAIVLVSIAVSSVLGGVIGEFSLISTFTITAGLMAVATLLALSPLAGRTTGRRTLGVPGLIPSSRLRGSSRARMPRFGGGRRLGVAMVASGVKRAA